MNQFVHAKSTYPFIEMLTYNDIITIKACKYNNNTEFFMEIVRCYHCIMDHIHSVAFKDMHS